MYTSLLIVLCDVQGTWFVVTSRTIAPTSIIKQGAIEYRDASSVWLQKHAQLLNYCTSMALTAGMQLLGAMNPMIDWFLWYCTAKHAKCVIGTMHPMLCNAASCSLEHLFPHHWYILAFSTWFVCLALIDTHVTIDGCSHLFLVKCLQGDANHQGQ